MRQPLQMQGLVAYLRSFMKPILSLVFLLTVGMGFVPAQRVKPAIARERANRLYTRAETRLASITFLTVANGAAVHSAGLDESTLNLGTLSNVTRENENGVQIQSQKHSFVVATRIGMRVDLSNSSHAGTATVGAYLLSPDPSRTVSIDNVRLSLTPAIIGKQVAYGATTLHTVRIVVPASMPPGQVLDLIGVIVTPN